MLYSGASLIRASGEQQEKINKLKLMPVSPVQAANPSGSGLDEDTQSALMRFARFIKKEREGKASPTSPPAQKGPHPYKRAFASLEAYNNCGLFLDTYI